MPIGVRHRRAADRMNARGPTFQYRRRTGLDSQVAFDVAPARPPRRTAPGHPSSSMWTHTRPGTSTIASRVAVDDQPQFSQVGRHHRQSARSQRKRRKYDLGRVEIV